MGSQTENDPFDIHDKKKVKIKEFLVYRESEDGQDNYIINRYFVYINVLLGYFGILTSNFARHFISNIRLLPFTIMKK